MVVSEGKPAIDAIDIEKAEDLEKMKEFYPRFSETEYARRRSLVYSLMDELGVDCLLVYGDSGHCYMNQANVRWLANYADHQYNYVVFPRRGEPTLFMSIPNMQPGAAVMASLADVQWATGAKHDLAEAVGRSVQSRGLDRGRVGIVGADSQRMPTVPHHHHVILSEMLPRAELHYVTAEFERLRQVQSGEEIDWLREGARFTDLAMEGLMEAIRPGVREHELYGAQHSAYLPLGGQLMFSLLSTTKMSDPRAAYPFPWPSTRQLEEGDILLTEISAAYWGYGGQLVRAVALGDPPQHFRDMFGLAVSVFEDVKGVLRPGTTGEEVQLVGQRIENAGYRSLGPLVHGWGLGMTYPYVGLLQSQGWDSDDVVFQEDQAVVLQPNVSTPDRRAGLVVGDLLHIRDDGAESLQNFPMELLVA